MNRRQFFVNASALALSAAFPSFSVIAATTAALTWEQEMLMWMTGLIQNPALANTRGFHTWAVRNGSRLCDPPKSDYEIWTRCRAATKHLRNKP